jgi:hypothetical protein
MSAVRVLRGLVLGALGGAFGWLLVEPIPYLTSDEVATVDWTAIGLLAGIVGACIGGPRASSREHGRSSSAR